MIRLAQQGRCQRFIGHPIVQTILENLWTKGEWTVESQVGSRGDGRNLADTMAATGCSPWSSCGMSSLTSDGSKTRRPRRSQGHRLQLKAVDDKYGSNLIKLLGIDVRDDRWKKGVLSGEQQGKAREALGDVAASLDVELGTESIMRSAHSKDEEGAARRAALLHGDSNDEEVVKRRNMLVHRLALERRFEDILCRAAKDLRLKQVESRPDGTIAPLLEASDRTTSVRWLWYCCPCCLRDMNAGGGQGADGDGTDDDGADTAGKLEYVNVLERSSGADGGSSSNNQGLDGIPKSLSVRSVSGSSSGVLLPASVPEGSEPGSTGSKHAVFRLPPVSSTSLVTNYG